MPTIYSRSNPSPLLFLDFFTDDLEGEYFNRWERCIQSWIESEIDDFLRREASSTLNNMAITLRSLRETLQGMTSVNSTDDMALYGNDQFELRLDADSIKTMVE